MDGSGVSEMKGLAMRYGMAVAALGSLLAGMAQAQAEPATPAASAPAAQGQKEVRPAIQWKRFDYTCKGAAKVTVYLHDPTARVQYKDQQYVMRRTKSADGNRYSDGRVVWWGKGDGGFLQEDSPNWNGKMIVEDCKLANPSPAAAPKKP